MGDGSKEIQENQYAEMKSLLLELDVGTSSEGHLGRNVVMLLMSK